MPATVTLTGDAEINRLLSQLKSSKAKQAIRKSSRTALKPVAEGARQNAPRRTGALGRSIKVRAIRRSRSRVGARVTTSSEARQFGGRRFYGAFQEYGWQVGRRTTNADLGVRKRKRRTSAQRAAAETRNAKRRRIPGKEYMKRAARSRRGLALSIYRTETRRWIRELSTK